MVGRPDARDHRRVVLGEAEAVPPEVGGSLVLLLVAPRLPGRGPLERDVPRRRSRVDGVDGVVEPPERGGVVVFHLLRRLLPDAVRPVVAGFVAVPRERREVHEDDLAWLDDAIGKVAPVGQVLGPEETMTSSTSSMPGIA